MDKDLRERTNIDVRIQEGLYWVNDVSLVVWKQYAGPDEAPQVEVTIRRMKGEDADGENNDSNPR